MHSIKSISTNYVAHLSRIYNANEAKSITNLVLSRVLQKDKVQLVLNANEKLKTESENILLEYLAELEKGKPVQYVLGVADFFDLIFKVNEHVLIPRPETELLVRWILEDCENEDISILDIGTGSGIIPVALKHALPNVKMNALDISVDALSIAKQNSHQNKAEVHFFLFDVLAEKALADKYDIMVSNPPYIPERDKQALHRNVREFEPNLALFVPDNDALLFYNRIADLALQSLKKPGLLYFEMYEEYALQISKMLELKGFQGIEIRKDQANKDRMIRAKLI